MEKSELKNEVQILRKLDKKLLPYLALLYLFSFLDRVNIGYARLFNLEEDLDLSSTEYSWCLSSFFIGYIIFEVPSNLVLKRISPPKWICRIMVSWGIATMAMSMAQGFKSLVLLRFILGCFEAGLTPGIIFYLSFWYTKKEQGIRIACFLSSASLAGAFGGLLAYSISTLDGFLDVKSWQWIFILEGFPSIIIGIVTWFYLPSIPSETKWLTSEEKEIIINRLKNDNINSDDKEFDYQQLIETLKDYKVYAYMFLGLGLGTSLYSMALLLPTIIKDFGLETTPTLLLACPPYLISLFTSFGISYHSDKKSERGYHLIGVISLCLIGYWCMMFLDSLMGRYLGTILVIVGINASSPIYLSWMSNNMNGTTKTAVASALTVSFANIGGVIAGQLYKPQDGPRHEFSNSLNMALIIFTIFLSLLLRYLLNLENKKKEKEEIKYIL